MFAQRMLCCLADDGGALGARRHRTSFRFVCLQRARDLSRASALECSSFGAPDRSPCGECFGRRRSVRAARACRGVGQPPSFREVGRRPAVGVTLGAGEVRDTLLERATAALARSVVLRRPRRRAKSDDAVVTQQRLGRVRPEGAAAVVLEHERRPEGHCPDRGGPRDSSRRRFCRPPCA